MNKNSFEDFEQAVDSYLNDACGMGYSDLPDVVSLDDYFEEGMDAAEFEHAVRDCAQEILVEAGANVYDD